MNLFRKLGFSREASAADEAASIPSPRPNSTTPRPSSTTQLENTTSNSDEVKPPEQQPEQGSIGATLWSILGSKLGGDVLTAGISLPSWLYEPLSILQRQAEMVEYGNVLSAAAACEDPVERLAYVAGFAVSGYSATQRYKPDFNPLLGETFEYVDKQHGTKFFAEQVSHHPPISALHVTNEAGWVFYQNSSPVTKFLGNNIDLDTQGRSYVVFPKTGEHYFYTNPECTRVHNIIFGKMWIEHFGRLQIENLKETSYSCTVNFKKSGLFQGTQYKVEGHIENNNGEKLVKLEGRWDSYFEATWLKDTTTNKKGTVKRLWTISDGQDSVLLDPYNFTPYSRSLNDINEELEMVLLPTDSRRRLDRHFLEKGDSDTATKWKKAMEERQRSDRKNRKAEWEPIWFRKEDGLWVYRGDYWEQRNAKLEGLRKGDEITDLLRPPQILGLACDFASYDPSVTLSPTSPNDTEGDITDTPTTDTITNDATDGNLSDTENEEWTNDLRSPCTVSTPVLSTQAVGQEVN